MSSEHLITDLIKIALEDAGYEYELHPLCDMLNVGEIDISVYKTFIYMFDNAFPHFLSGSYLPNYDFTNPGYDPAPIIAKILEYINESQRRIHN